jgi:hypothetical protein
VCRGGGEGTRRALRAHSPSPGGGGAAPPPPPPHTRARLTAPVTASRLGQPIVARLVSVQVWLVRAIRTTIRELDAAIAKAVKAHPWAGLIVGLPRIGTVNLGQVIGEIGPMLERASSCAQLAAETGAAPVTKESGKHRAVSFRHAVNRRARQALMTHARQLPRFEDHPWLPRTPGVLLLRKVAPDVQSGRQPQHLTNLARVGDGALGVPEQLGGLTRAVAETSRSGSTAHWFGGGCSHSTSPRRVGSGAGTGSGARSPAAAPMSAAG